MRQTARSLKRVFLRDLVIPLRKKGLVIQSLVLSRGMHLAGRWSCLLPQEARSLTRAVVDTIRPLAEQVTESTRLSDEAVLRLFGVLAPVRLVTLMRLNAAVGLAVRASPQLLALVLRLMVLSAPGIKLCKPIASMLGRPRVWLSYEGLRGSDGLFSFGQHLLLPGK